MTEAREAPWAVVFAAEAINDLRLISDHLIQASQDHQRHMLVRLLQGSTS